MPSVSAFLQLFSEKKNCVDHLYSLEYCCCSEFFRQNVLLSVSDYKTPSSLLWTFFVIRINHLSVPIPIQKALFNYLATSLQLARQVNNICYCDIAVFLPFSQ